MTRGYVFVLHETKGKLSVVDRYDHVGRKRRQEDWDTTKERVLTSKHHRRLHARLRPQPNKFCDDAFLIQNQGKRLRRGGCAPSVLLLAASLPWFCNNFAANKVAGLRRLILERMALSKESEQQTSFFHR